VRQRFIPGAMANYPGGAEWSVIADVIENRP
jgi:hypothetical protein